MERLSWRRNLGGCVYAMSACSKYWVSSITLPHCFPMTQSMALVQWFHQYLTLTMIWTNLMMRPRDLTQRLSNLMKIHRGQVLLKMLLPKSYFVHKFKIALATMSKIFNTTHLQGNLALSFNHRDLIWIQMKIWTT